MMRLRVVLLVLGALLLAALAAPPSTSQAVSAPAGNVRNTVLTCFNVQPQGPAGINYVVNVDDVYEEAAHFATRWPAASYLPLYDVTGAASVVNLADVLAVAGQYGRTCSTLETQVALAARAAEPYVMLDSAPLDENGYVRSTQWVPGQGTHYSRVMAFNSSFDPENPQGLVYDANGRLVALFYVMWGGGGGIGWFGQGGHVEKENIDAPAPCSGTCAPPSCASSAGGCSWLGSEDLWHAHSGLCIVNIDTPNAYAASGTSQPACNSLPGSSHLWFEQYGWMNHLWAFKRNPNGRFADCEPPFGYSDCPD